MTQLHKYGDPGPVYDEGFGHCGEITPPDEEELETGGEVVTSRQVGDTTTGNESSTEASYDDKFVGDTRASLCSFGNRAVPASGGAALLVMLVGLLWFVRRPRRRGNGV